MRVSHFFSNQVSSHQATAITLTNSKHLIITETEYLELLLTATQVVKAAIIHLMMNEIIKAVVARKREVVAARVQVIIKVDRIGHWSLS